MNQFYKIIYDEGALREYLVWLPEPVGNECFYGAIFSRRKYITDGSARHKSTDKQQVARFDRRDKEYIIDTLRRYEQPVGTFKVGKHPCQQESLVVYLMPNPRCQKKAMADMLQRGMKMYVDDSKGYSLKALALGCVQRAKSYNYVVDFDIDTKDFDLTKISALFTQPEDVFRVVEGRGGYHILVHPERADARFIGEKHWYKAIQTLAGKHFDQAGDMLCPVPGTCHGGFVPKFLTPNKDF